MKLLKEYIKKLIKESSNEANLASLEVALKDGLVVNNIEGRFLTPKQAKALEDEIQSNYIDGDMMQHFSGEKQDIRMNLYNYEHPIAEKDVNGVNLRIVEGLVRNKRKTYLLYADGKLIGEFYSVEDIKRIINYIEKQLVTNISERKSLKENVNELVDFDGFPSDVRKTLENEYGDFDSNFDWNQKADEFENPEDFSKWLKQNKSEQFIKKINVLISKTRQDLILLKRQKMAEKALEYFEELIKPALGHEVLTEPLSMFLHKVIMNPDVTAKELEIAFREAKNIIDADGSINQEKITPSAIFAGGDINIPKFEEFVRKNPEYRGVFKDWKKLNDRYMDLFMTDLNAFRSSTPYEEIKKLYDFLVTYKKEKNI
jgi:hypothetical protein